ncbi:GNAT family N-acetyltransferase [Blastomonas sp.]|uniref:GNAT family N-acetyltransferase n=1 Tax=Blastomonas sp. TaxID=1909299 RepID=UPI0026071F16|nr:GNAT family N-acetyltransferase [Blastomonas sp.]MDM7954843.1 GNAT family N-acetyltransferase [Blastomonas sp.]
MTSKPARADVITCALEIGLPTDLDRLAEAGDPARGFLRRAWYAAETRQGLCTLLARRRDGTPVIAIPTRPIGPSILRARSVTASYWPFRSFPMASDATEAEVAALLGCPIVQRAIGPALRIGPVYADDPGLQRVVSVAPALGWSVLTRELGTTYLQDIGAQSTQDTWPGKSQTRKLKAYERKLHEVHGELRLRVVTGSDWSDQVWRDLAEIETQSWVGTQTDHSGAKFINRDNLRHWQTAVTDPVIASQLRAMILYASDRPIAFSFDLEAGDVMYGIASSYAEDMARFSPGKIITIHLITQAIERGVRTIDWGSGDTGYKRALGATAGPQIIDIMMVRGHLLAAAIKPRWEMTRQSASLALAEGLAASLGELTKASAVRLEHVLFPGLALTAAAAAMSE